MKTVRIQVRDELHHGFRYWAWQERWWGWQQMYVCGYTPKECLDLAKKKISDANAITPRAVVVIDTSVQV